MAAAAKGVQVIVIGDLGMLAAHLSTCLFQRLVAADIPVCVLQQESLLFHPKFALVDERIFFNGSSNASDRGLGKRAAAQTSQGAAPDLLPPRNIEANSVNVLKRGERFWDHYDEFWAWIDASRPLTLADITNPRHNRGFASGEEPRARAREKRPRVRHVCEVEGCTKYVHGHGMCRQHYNHHKPQIPCSIAGCTKIVLAKGLCGQHYTPPRQTKSCKELGCENRVFARDLCKKHYSSARPRKVCSVDGCTTSVKARGVCYKHDRNRPARACVVDACKHAADLAAGYEVRL